MEGNGKDLAPHLSSIKALVKIIVLSDNVEIYKWLSAPHFEASEALPIVRRKKTISVRRNQTSHFVIVSSSE
jgi:hypothetical protein